MKVTTKRTINLQQPGWVLPIDVMKGDVNSREVELTLMAGNAAWEIPQTATVRICYGKQDGKGGQYDLLPDGSAAWSASGNVLTVQLAPQMLTKEGIIPYSVILTQGDTQLSSFPMPVHVHSGVTPLEGSEEYFNVSGLLPAPAEALAGQYLRIAEIDPTGRVLRVEGASAQLGGLATYQEENNIGSQQNAADSGSPLWSQWNGRLAFGMNSSQAPVPFLVGGQLLADGTIIARNSGDKGKNRHGFHVYEAYAKDNHSRMTLLLDKHSQEASGKPSMELYYYTGANHFASSYANTKIGSDVALHSFCFDRDKLTAYGEIDSKMPITLARISLSKDLNPAYSTVAAADAAYEPETQAVENSKCLKYLALKHAENGAMFYDTDRQKPVMKISGKWCEIPFTVISDAAYDILTEDGVITLTWENGVYNQRGESVANDARLRTTEYLPDTVTHVRAEEGYEFGVLFLDDNHWADDEAYYNASTGSLQHAAVYYTELDLTGLAFEAYPNRKLIARRKDLAAITPAEGGKILCT